MKLAAMPIPVPAWQPDCLAAVTRSSRIETDLDPDVASTVHAGAAERHVG